MNDILNKWGINIPHNEWFMEYLIEAFPEKTYFIDELPISIGEENGYKIDCIFRMRKHRSRADKKCFEIVENKYINLLTKLWMYNKVFVYAEKYSNEDLRRIPFKHRGKYKKFQQMLERNDMLEIKCKEQLYYFVQLGTQGIAQASFYFEDYEMIIVPSWSCFIVYFNDLKNINLVKKLVEINGLFLREADVEKD